MRKRWDKRKRKNFSRKVDNKTLLKFTHEFHFFQRKIKRKFLILIHIADTADSSGSELGWVRFGQTEPELSGQVNPMIKGFVNIRRKFALRTHNSSAALRRQSSSHRQVTSQFLNFKFFLLVCVWNDVSKWIVEIPTTRKIFLNNCYIKTFLWIDCVWL